MRKIHTPAMRAKVLELHQQGNRPHVIGKLLEIPAATVAKWIRIAKRPPKVKEPEPEPKREGRGSGVIAGPVYRRGFNWMAGF